MIEPMTSEAGVYDLALTTGGKTQKSFCSTFISTCKIPVFFLLLFISFTLQALYPDTFNFGFKRQKSYQFKSESLGFFIGDIGFFQDTSQEETEARIVALFPQELQGKVKKVIRPVLILCEKHQLDPFWVLSVMWTESHFKHDARSHKGAQGLMQVMPPTFKETLGKMKKAGINLEADRSENYLRYQYEHTFYSLGYSKLVAKLRNLEVGIYYLKGLLKFFDNNHLYATVAYNMGPYWTKSRLRKNLPVGKKNHYLNKVMRAYTHITKELGQYSNVTFIQRI